MQVGIGGNHASIAVYIANRPPLGSFQNLATYRALQFGEVAEIVDKTGNHWRKIFNCFAKILFAIHSSTHASWQTYRDRQLLQHDCQAQLLFSPPDLLDVSKLHIVSGKTYFSALQLGCEISWVDEAFAIAQDKPLLVAPYFDYRQLSNQRIAQLVELIRSYRPRGSSMR